MVVVVLLVIRCVLVDVVDEVVAAGVGVVRHHYCVFLLLMVAFDVFAKYSVGVVVAVAVVAVGVGVVAVIYDICVGVGVVRRWCRY